MTDYWYLIPLVGLPTAVFLGLTIGRISVYGHWHKRYRHTCGFHTKFTHEQSPCASCGDDSGKWAETTMKATWPFGWQERG
jgi:hypothetical protein